MSIKAISTLTLVSIALLHIGNANADQKFLYRFKPVPGNEFKSVEPVGPLSISGEQNYHVRMGTPIDMSLSGSGGQTPYRWTTTGDTLPTGLSFIDGRLSGTPTSTGTYSFAVNLEDSSSPTLTATTSPILLDIIPYMNISGLTSITKRTGQPINEQYTVHNALNPTDFSLSGNIPAGISLTPSGLLTGTSSQTGLFTITASASDTFDSAASTLDIDLQIDAPPSISVPSSTSAAAGSAVSITPTATNIHGTASWTVTGSLPSGLSINTASGQITGAPSAIGTYSGLSLNVTDSFDNAQGHSAVFSIQVTDPCAANPAVGQLCADGSRYAGLSGGARMFATASDAPGGASYSWDAAAAYCSAATTHGKSDWRVPTISELQTLFNGRFAISGFNTSYELGLYWSSTKVDSDLAWAFYFYDGSNRQVEWPYDYGPQQWNVRCVR